MDDIHERCKCGGPDVHTWKTLAHIIRLVSIDQPLELGKSVDQKVFAMADNQQLLHCETGVMLDLVPCLCMVFRPEIISMLSPHRPVATALLGRAFQQIYNLI